MSLVDNVVSGVRWGAALKIIIQAVSWFVTIYIIRLLSPDDYAMMALVDMGVSSFVVLATLGLGGAIIKNTELTQQQLRSALSVLIIVNAIAFSLIYIFYEKIEIFFDFPGLGDALFVASFLFILSPFATIYDALLSRDIRFKEMELIKLFAVIFQLITNFVLATLGYGYWSLIIGFLVMAVIRITLSIIRVGYVLVPTLHIRDISQLIKDASDNFIHTVIWEFNDRVDRFMISKLAGNNHLGLYNMSYTLAEKPVALAGSMIQLIGVASYSKLRHDQSKVGEYVTKSTLIICILMVPVFFGISAVAGDLVPLFLGEKWSAAILPLQILSIAQIFNMLRLNIGAALFALGYGRRKILHAIVASVIFVLSWVIGLGFGFIEGCFGFLIGYSVWFIWHVIDSHKMLSLDLYGYFKAILLPMIFSSIMFIFVRVVDITLLSSYHIAIQLLVEVLLGAVIYATLLFVFYRPGIEYIFDVLIRKRAKND